MSSKNDLSALKVKSKNTLGNLQQTMQTNNPLEVAVVQTKSWRKPKPLAEKQTEMVGLRFTKSELKEIKRQAGLVPIATYLKSRLN